MLESEIEILFSLSKWLGLLACTAYFLFFNNWSKYFHESNFFCWSMEGVCCMYLTSKFEILLNDFRIKNCVENWEPKVKIHIEECLFEVHLNPSAKFEPPICVDIEHRLWGVSCRSYWWFRELKSKRNSRLIKLYKIIYDYHSIFYFAYQTKCNPLFPLGVGIGHLDIRVREGHYYSAIL